MAHRVSSLLPPGETPGSNRLEISGTKGRLLLENDRLVLTRNAVPSDEWCKTSKIGFKQPETTVEEIDIPAAEAPHSILMTNFTDAILKGENLIAPGEEGSVPWNWPTRCFTRAFWKGLSSCRWMEGLGKRS